MDPRMRFAWWTANDWGNYAQMSEDMVKNVWEQHYKGKEGPIEIPQERKKNEKKNPGILHFDWLIFQFFLDWLPFFSSRIEHSRLEQIGCFRLTAWNSLSSGTRSE